MNKKDGTKLTCFGGLVSPSLLFLKDQTLWEKLCVLCVSVTLPAYDAHPLESWHQQRLAGLRNMSLATYGKQSLFLLLRKPPERGP